MYEPTVSSASLSFSAPAVTDAEALGKRAAFVSGESFSSESPVNLIRPESSGDGAPGLRPPSPSAGQLFLQEVRQRLRYYQFLADSAIAQVDDEGFFYARGRDSNSIAIIVKHLVGNMRSRFTDFLTSDGEKPDRKRDDEFQRFVRDTRERLEFALEHAWELVIDTVDEITEDMLVETVYIRNQPLSVLEAVNRQLTHYAYHVGQIVYLSKQACGDDWKSLSIPKGQSEEFNRQMTESEPN